MTFTAVCVCECVFVSAVACCCVYTVQSERLQRALDVGCGVGRMTFELARVYDDVVGIDYSRSFVDTCCVLRDKGRLRYNVQRQGEITSELVAIVDSAIVNSTHLISVVNFIQKNLPVDRTIR